jgi:hypothetical protein
MHGLDCDPIAPAEVIEPLASTLRSCHGLRSRRCEFEPEDLMTVRGLPATTVLRTLRDICLTCPLIESLVFIDMALHAGITDAGRLGAYVARGDRKPGVKNMRALVPLAAPAESPMETRLRWLLVCAGLPSPDVQVDLLDGGGLLLGRADLYYPPARLVIEFDGGCHRDRLVLDDRRQNQLIRAGYTVLRYTSADFYGRPNVIVAQVRAALSESSMMDLAPKTPLRRPDWVALAPNTRNGDAA